MAKIESTFLNMVLTLLVITAVASLALGGIFKLTEEPIRLAKEAAERAAIKAVIPEFDSIYSFKVLPAEGKDSLTYNVGYSGEEVVGTAITSYTNKGYDPTQIQVMVGFLPDGHIANTQVLQQKETPGLGTKLETPEFRDQFKGIDPATFKLEVKKDGGDVDAITAATISSRAFCDAVVRAYDSYKKVEGGNK